MTTRRDQPGVSAIVAVMALALAMLLPGCSRSRTADIRPNYAAESSTTYEISVHAQTNQAVMISGERGVADTLAARFTVRVVDAHDDGGAEIEVTLERLVNRTLGATELRVDFDSDRPDEENSPESLLGVYRAALEARVRLSMDAEGRAITATGLEEIESALDGSRHGEFLGDVFREAWWTDLAESVFRLGCEQPRVGVGDTWSSARTETQELYMTLSELVDYTVVTVTGDRVEIEGEGGYAVDMSKDAFASVEGGSIDEQAISSRVVWDRTHGRLSDLHEERLLQLSQTWQGVAIAKRYVMTRDIRRVAGTGGDDAGDR